MSEKWRIKSGDAIDKMKKYIGIEAFETELILIDQNEQIQNLIRR